MRFRWLMLLVAATLVAAACAQTDSSSSDSATPDSDLPQDEQPDTTPDFPDPSTPSTAPDPAEERTPSDRIVVVDDAQISTMLPDGSDVVPLTSDETTVNVFPTWSPDATRIAWTRADTGTGSAQIATSRFDGSAAFDIDVDTPPFYYYWDPGSRQLAYLSPTVGGIDLGVVDVTGEGEPRRVDRGQPYYFSWNPDGDQMLVHASALRLDRIDLEGTTVIIDEAPGTFQAPEWTSDARALVYAQTTPEGDVLVSSGTDGEGRLELASYDGYLTFVVSPASNRIALQVVDPTNLADPGVVTASAQSQPGVPVPQISTGELVMVATFGSDPIPVSSVAATAFFWSPDGQGLAWVEPKTLNGEPWYQWFFLTAEGFIDGPLFRPSDTLLSEYFPFFDQFAKSITFWSPGGDRIVYAGTDTEGNEGIFVHEVSFGGTTTQIAEGEFAAWSPTTAGDAAASSL